MDVFVLYEAIGEIREDYILDAEAVRVKKQVSWSKRLIAACIALALIAVPVSAEWRTGYVSNLLAPLYGSTQTELVDSIGVPIGASVTVGDYTLTADAMIGDRYHIAIVYSLVHKDGEVLSEWLRFDNQSSTVLRGTGGGSYAYVPSEDGTVMYIVEEWECSNPLLLTGRIVEVSFHDLGIWDNETGTFTCIAEGDWELALTLRYEDMSVKVPIKMQTVHDAAGDAYEIREIILSPVGVHLEMTAPNPYPDGIADEPMMTEFNVSVKLTDGTVLHLDDRNMSANGDLSEERHDATFGAMFPQPVALEDVAAIVICGTEFPVDLSE